MSGHATDISYPPTSICRLRAMLTIAELNELPEDVRRELLAHGSYEQTDVESYLVDSQVTRHAFKNDEGKTFYRMEFGHSRPLEVEAGQSVGFELCLTLGNLLRQPLI